MLRIAGFRADRIRALVNVAVLTTGFDVPDVDLIALARNTQSPVLYVQIAGRGMRTAHGKRDCLWLDFTDTTSLLGPVDEVKGRSKLGKNEGGQAPFKVCDHCGASNPAGAAECGQCQAEFPPPASTVNTVASQASVLSGAPRLETIGVDGITYGIETAKTSGAPYLRISFDCGLESYRLNLMLSHDGYARQKAMQDWRRLTWPRSNPRNAEEAALLLKSGAVGFKRVLTITIDMNSKWKNVVGMAVQQEAALH